MEYRECRKCHKLLPQTEFHKDPHSKGGYRYVCKKCSIRIAVYSKQRAKKRSNDPALRDVYWGIMGRCYNPDHISYPHYGARGIVVCDEWKNSINAFVKWAKDNGYKYGLQIDRKDNDKGYSPENCHWVTRAENQHNTSQTVLDDTKVSLIRRWDKLGAKTQKEMAEILGVSQSRISDVINNKTWKK